MTEDDIAKELGTEAVVVMNALADVIVDKEIPGIDEVADTCA